MVLENCERCLVYGEDGRILSRGRVSLVGEYIFLYFENIDSFRDARCRQQVDCFDGEGRVTRGYCELLIKENHHYPEMLEPWMAQCRVLRIGQGVRQQKDVRARVDLNVAFVSLEYGPFVGTVRNISAGGVYVTTDQKLKKQDVILFNHAFSTVRRQVKAEVIWARPLSGDAFGYGCQFLDLTSEAERDVRHFVNRRLMFEGSRGN